MANGQEAPRAPSIRYFAAHYSLLAIRHSLLAIRRLSVGCSRPHLWCRALILRRACDLAAELERGMPAPMRIVENRARERDLIGLALGEQRLGLFRRDDEPDHARRDGGFAAYLLGERRIVAGRGRIARVRGDSAGRDAHEVEAGALQGLRTG